MADANETARILSADTHSELQRQRDEQIAKILELRLVQQQLSKIRVKDLNLPDDGEHVQLKLNALKVSEYMRLNGDKEKQPDYLLNLGDCVAGELSYMECKAVREKLTVDLAKHLEGINTLGRKLHTEFPELFQQKDKDYSAEPALQRIVSLEQERCKKLEKLTAVRNRKCALLKMAAELKMGPYLGQKLEELLAHARLNQTKANVLYSYLVNELMSRSEHTYKALREVEAYVDELLEEMEN